MVRVMNFQNFPGTETLGPTVEACSAHLSQPSSLAAAWPQMQPKQPQSSSTVSVEEQNA